MSIPQQADLLNGTPITLAGAEVNLGGMSALTDQDVSKLFVEIAGATGDTTVYADSFLSETGAAHQNLATTTVGSAAVRDSAVIGTGTTAFCLTFYGLSSDPFVQFKVDGADGTITSAILIK